MASKKPVKKAKRVEKNFAAKLIAAERKVERQIVLAENHALDRLPYWAGMSMLMLAGVMALHGAADIVYLTTAFGGTLACIIE